jgi:hypothetical protein
MLEDENVLTESVDKEPSEESGDPVVEKAMA